MPGKLKLYVSRGLNKIDRFQNNADYAKVLLQADGVRQIKIRIV